MTNFLRLLADKDKETNLLASTLALRNGESNSRVFSVDPVMFGAVPGAPFAYWVSDSVRDAFKRFECFEGEKRNVRVGLQTSDDFRFLRNWWESNQVVLPEKWFPIAKGGSYSTFYTEPNLVLNWQSNGRELKAWADPLYGNSGWSRIIKSTEFYCRPGLTWPRRTGRFGVRVLPSNCIFADKGPSAFVANNEPEDLLVLLALMTSRPFESLIEPSLNAGDRNARSYEVGIIQKTPIPDVQGQHRARLRSLALRIWSLKRNLDTVQETSHAFILPNVLRVRVGDYDPKKIEMESVQIQSEIDDIAFELYGFSEDDRTATYSAKEVESEERTTEGNDLIKDDLDDENGAAPIDGDTGLLSWAMGVAFGRFDWRLATGEREVPAEPEPFDPLPTRSPGMLPDVAEPFHSHAGILVDDEGHPHDLAYILEEVLQRVDAPVLVDTRRWLQREFFPFHLQRYSKSRRRAPIYWPLSTLSGAYTLWIYYPDLTSQTLFTAVNDFIEPKIQQVRGDLESLVGRGNARNKQDEKQLEIATDLARELADLRDVILAIAPKYSPNHDDGVQISAAPLWQLFRHKPWQKVLKVTWEKLEQGDYVWAHLAMNYWPERVLRKCHQERSLAIAHGIESTFWSEVEVSIKRGEKSAGETKLEWQPKNLTDYELNALIDACIKEKTT
jgi:hypothetical protein